MRILADLHISPSTVEFLKSLGHEAVRVNEILPATAPDQRIVEVARAEGQTILAQDLDFSAIIALSGESTPSLICLRLASSRVEHVNHLLEEALPHLEQDVKEGVIVTITDTSLRRRRLPLQ